VNEDCLKLTAYFGERDGLGSRFLADAFVEIYARHRLRTSLVMRGVEGFGAKQHLHTDRLLTLSEDLPLVAVAVDSRTRIEAALHELQDLRFHGLVTLERIRVCKRDGVRLAEPHDAADTDASGLGVWQKLMVYAGKQSRHGGHQLNTQLVRALRRAGAAGATSLRGIWGYHGDHQPHGDVFWQLRRRVPILTVIVDTPDRIRDWFAIVDELTDETGLVTSEMVPAYRATGPQLRHGGLRLAHPMR
jgi:PII-like signaling protein